MSMQYEDLLITCDRLRKEKKDFQNIYKKVYGKQLSEMSKRYDNSIKEMAVQSKKLERYEKKIKKNGLIIDLDLTKIISDSMINMFNK